MPTEHAAYTELCSLARQWCTLGSTASLLGWDQETYMPDRAGPFRAEQRAMLAGLIHERMTGERVGELIAACEGDSGLMADPAAAADVREFRRDYDLAAKLPGDLVTELARVGSEAQQAWKQAREKSDFAMFRPYLERLVGLARRKAECYGVPEGGELYDALLNEFEPDLRSARVEELFTPLCRSLSALVAELAGSGGAPDTRCLDVKIPADRQHAFGLFVLESIGFDLTAGRLDVTTHPFCSGMAPGDTRLTTRYREQHFTDALYGTLHEAGHGLYEQGLPKGELFGRPLSQSISLGIHESQSRMWENFVGRSRRFWDWAMPHAKRLLGPVVGEHGQEAYYRAVNTASPSFIRVESDEATYNLHIMVRFRVERAIIRGDVGVADVPGLWNETFREYLGLEVPDDRRGCLQDVHWSFGAIGYFPTYCLGNLYAAQLWETIRERIPDLDEQIASGRFAPLLEWLRTNIHAHGRRYRAEELCRELTGRELEAAPLLRHLEGKLRPVYGL